LEGRNPMIFIDPADSWIEFLGERDLKCHTETSRNIEYQLRQKLFRHRYIHDDYPIEAEVIIPKVIENTMWGISSAVISPEKTTGAWRYKPVVEEPKDWDKLKIPTVSYDEYESMKLYDEAAECLSDILPVRLIGRSRFNFHLMSWYCEYRGLDNMLSDLYDDPVMVREIIGFFAEGVKHMFAQYERQGLISLNNNGTLFYTGGLGYNEKELPQPDFDGVNVRLRDIWGAAEAQEFSCVSPDMHEEFVLSFERDVLKSFGLTGYGCCDDLSEKLDGVLKTNNLRRVAVCPWADIEKFTPVLKNNFIMTWKPQPAYLAFDELPEDQIRNELRTGIRKARGGIIELILRDITTCRGDPERFNKWIVIARQAIDDCWE